MRKERINILFGGLVGFTSVTFIQLLTADTKSLDISLNTAIIIFSFTLPLSVFYTLSAQSHLKTGKNKVPRWYEIVAVITIFASFIGITALFSHFGLIPAVIFFIISFFAIWYFNHLDTGKQYYFSAINNNAQKGKKKRNPVR